MIRAANDRTMGADEARLLTTVHADVTLGRAAFAGQPFHIEDERRAPGQPRTTFSEALVLRMIASGMLYATQQAEAWPGRNVPARPYSIRMTKDGERERIRLLRHLTVAAAA